MFNFRYQLTEQEEEWRALDALGRIYSLMVKRAPPHKKNPTTRTWHHPRRAITRFIAKEIVRWRTFYQLCHKRVSAQLRLLLVIVCEPHPTPHKCHASRAHHNPCVTQMSHFMCEPNTRCDRNASHHGQPGSKTARCSTQGRTNIVNGNSNRNLWEAAGSPLCIIVNYCVL